MKRLATLVAAIAFTVACGAPAVHVLPADTLPDDIYGGPSPTPRPLEPRSANVWFVRDGKLSSTVRTTHETGSLLRFALEQLLAGPSEDERRNGVSTAIPLGVQLVAVSRDGRTAVVDLSSSFELGAEQREVALRLAQVVFTATEIAEVTEVRFFIEGEPADVVAQHGTLQTEPVGRQDYADLVA